MRPVRGASSNSTASRNAAPATPRARRDPRHRIRRHRARGLGFHADRSGAACRRARGATAAIGRRVRAGRVRRCDPHMTRASRRRCAPRVDARRRRHGRVHRAVRRQRVAFRNASSNAGRIRAEHGLTGAQWTDICGRRRSDRARGAGARPACARFFIRTAAATSKHRTRSTS